MSKLVSLDKQLEKLATKWYIKEHYGEQLKDMNKELRTEYMKKIRASLNKEDVIEQYFKAKPEMKRQYKERKQRINRIKIAAGLGLLTVAMGTGIAYTRSAQDTREEQEISFDFEVPEYTKNMEKIEDISQKKQEDQEYKQFFETVRDTSNTKKRDDEILQFTKKEIVEKYNKNNVENPITLEQLEYLHLDEYVLAQKDKFGNDVEYKRVSQRENIYEKEGEELKKISGGIYEFKIDGKTVAVYDSNGQEIIDNNIEQKEVFFKDTLNLVKKANELQNVYKYKNSETDIKKVENEYKIAVQKFVEENDEQKNKEENIRLC